MSRRRDGFRRHKNAKCKAARNADVVPVQSSKKAVGHLLKRLRKRGHGWLYLDCRGSLLVQEDVTNCGIARGEGRPSDGASAVV